MLEYYISEERILLEDGDAAFIRQNDAPLGLTSGYVTEVSFKDKNGDEFSYIKLDMPEELPMRDISVIHFGDVLNFTGEDTDSSPMLIVKISPKSGTKSFVDAMRIFIDIVDRRPDLIAPK